MLRLTLRSIKVAVCLLNIFLGGIIIIRLAKDDTRIGNDLIDLLHGLFGGMEYSKKLERLNELGLDVSLVRKEMGQMCNLSERILERGIERGMS